MRTQRKTQGIKKFILKLAVGACVLGTGATAWASSMAQCVFLVRVLKVSQSKASPQRKQVEFHVLDTLQTRNAMGGCYDQRFIGARKSAVIQVKGKLKRGDTGRLNHTVIHSHPLPDGSAPVTRRWGGWAPLKLTPKMLKKLRMPGVPFKQVKQRLRAAEKLSTKGKALPITTSRKIKLNDVYTTCLPGAKGKPPVYCMFTVSIPHKDGRFLIVAMFSKGLRKGIDLQSLRKHFSYMSVETPIWPLRARGWVTLHNSINRVLRRPKLGKEIRLLRYSKGVVYGEAIAETYRKVQLHSTTRPCAPFVSRKKLVHPCIVRGTRKVRVKLRFALPLGLALKRCQKNPKAPRCR